MYRTRHISKKEFFLFVLAMLAFNVLFLLLSVPAYAQPGATIPHPVYNVVTSSPSLIAPAGSSTDTPVPSPATDAAKPDAGISPEKNGALPAPLAPPANDDCAGAIALTPGASCSPYSTTSNGGTQSVAGITCGGFTGNANDDVWFKFTPTANAYRIEVQGAANMDAVIDLRQGPACNGNNVACADYTVGGGLEVLDYTGFVPGTTYYIRVYDYAAGGAGWGDFTICIVYNPPANADCSAGLNPPYVLSPNTSCTPGTLSMSATQSGEVFSCASPVPTRSVWYSFIATQTNMWVSISPDPPGGAGCSPNFSLTAYRYNSVCPPTAVAGCKNFQTYNTNYVYNNLELTGLSVGATYLVQVAQHPGCSPFDLFDFCIKVGTYLNCATCASPCGPMCTFVGYAPPGPPAGTVVSSCPGYPLGPPMNQFDTETNCYSFTAPNDTIYLQQVVWSYCFPQTYSFTYSLYTAGCGLIQSGSVFTNNMITGLVPGTNYRICYSLQAACSWDSLIYPYLFTSNSVLPVELVGFQAESHKDRILVTWTSASEINNREYILEKTRNAVEFTEVARVQGAGNSTSLIRYEVPDKYPFEGMNFYRLRQIDFDGTEHTTKLISARFEKAGPSISVAPNPATDQVLVRYFSEKNSSTLIRLYDVKGGIQVNRDQVSTTTQFHDLTLDLSGLGPGVYFLQVVSDDAAETSKLIKH